MSALAMMCSLRWADVEIGESLKPSAFTETYSIRQLIDSCDHIFLMSHKQGS